jgi:hypothetical protein
MIGATRPDNGSGTLRRESLPSGQVIATSAGNRCELPQNFRTLGGHGDNPEGHRCVGRATVTPGLRCTAIPDRFRPIRTAVNQDRPRREPGSGGRPRHGGGGRGPGGGGRLRCRAAGASTAAPPAPALGASNRALVGAVGADTGDRSWISVAAVMWAREPGPEPQAADPFSQIANRPQKLADGSLNVLLLGSDSRDPGHPGRGADRHHYDLAYTSGPRQGVRDLAPP